MSRHPRYPFSLAVLGSAVATALLLLVAPAAFADGTPTVESDEAEVATVDQVVPSGEVVEQEPTVDRNDLDSVLPPSALEIAMQQATTGYECPPFSDYCRFDRQCDALCGTGAGVCSFGCCYCAF